MRFNCGERLLLRGSRRPSRKTALLLYILIGRDRAVFPLALLCLAEGGRIVHRQVKLRRAAALNALDVFGGHVIDNTFGRVLLRFFFFFRLWDTRTVFNRGDQTVDRHVHRRDELHQQKQRKNNVGAGSRQAGFQQNRQESAEQAACQTLVSSEEQCFYHLPLPFDLRTLNQMIDRRYGQQNRKGTEDPQAHRLALAGKEDDAGNQQSQRQHIATRLANQAGNQPDQRLEEKGVGIKAAYDGKNREKNAENRPDLSAVLSPLCRGRALGLFGRLCRAFLLFTLVCHFKLLCLQQGSGVDQCDNQHDHGRIPAIVGKHIKLLFLYQIAQILNRKISENSRKRSG